MGRVTLVIYAEMLNRICTKQKEVEWSKRFFKLKRKLHFGRENHVTDETHSMWIQDNLCVFQRVKIKTFLETMHCISHRLWPQATPLHCVSQREGPQAKERTQHFNITLTAKHFPHRFDSIIYITCVFLKMCKQWEEIIDDNWLSNSKKLLWIY